MHVYMYMYICAVIKIDIFRSNSIVYSGRGRSLSTVKECF